MSQRPIAVLGIGCRFPGADDPEMFWQNILEGHRAIVPVPGERWSASAFDSAANGAPYCENVGASADLDCYDAAFFGIKDDEARGIDPQQGAVLEAAWHACESAGIVPDSLAGRNAGVFMGVSTRDFDRRVADAWSTLNAQSAMGSCGAVAANRLSYTFGLTGPSMSIDTACASSLTAVHQACRALHDGECDMAFAGGVQVILSPTNLVAFARDGILSKRGGCKPFSQDADGYIFGEGVGILLLKPLDQALRDGDRIRAIIRGSAVNHNGRSNGLSAPYGAALQQVMQSALERAGVAPQTVDYVEAHAVGTPIGDAIEMQAIRKVYGENRPSARPCRIGSVKPNIGHLEAASGVAALVKAMLAMEAHTYPASLDCLPQNAMLRFDPAVMQLCESNQPWPAADTPRRAAVSAFGFGGANAHVVIEQAPAPDAASDVAQDNTSGPWVLMISARGEAAFRQLRRRYAEQLTVEREAGAALDRLRDFCRASVLTRQHLPLRRALLVTGWADAVAQLDKACPAAAPQRRYRIGVSLASAMQSGPGAADLATALTQLGIRKLYLLADADAVNAAALAGYADRAGIPVGTYDEAAPPYLDCLIATISDGSQADVDLQWAPDRRASLVAGLVEQGFSLNLQGLRVLLGDSRRTLPLYPFERRRNHLLADAIAHREFPQH